MALPFPQFCKVKNKYCIAYYGPNTEYILQLLYLRPAIEKELPGLEIYISCRDEYKYLIGNQENIIFASNLDNDKRKVAYIRELRCNLQQHPVLELIEESNLTLNFLEPPAIKSITTKTCIICPRNILPTQPIPNLEKIKQWVVNQGFSPMVSNDISMANWVIGPENEQLFMAAIQGIKTTLIPTGLGTKLYRKLFPSGEIYIEEHI